MAPHPNHNINTRTYTSFQNIYWKFALVKMLKSLFPQLPSLSFLCSPILALKQQHFLRYHTLNYNILRVSIMKEIVLYSLHFTGEPKKHASYRVALKFCAIECLIDT